ncbi:hypothetical protein AAVH_00439 [Aphelenchoides avenae]|nr:hypothetical protein AAVH_00439 [Aphelenchus avenae]
MPGCRSEFDHLVGRAGYEFLWANNEEDGNRRKKLKRIIALFQDGGSMTFPELTRSYQAKWGRKLRLDDLNWIFNLECATVQDVFQQKSGIFHMDASTGDIRLALTDLDDDSDDIFDIQQCSRSVDIFAEEEDRVEQDVQRRLQRGLELYERLSGGPMNIKELCEATGCRQKDIECVLKECQAFFVKKGSRISVIQERSVDGMEAVLRDGLRPPAYPDKIHQDRVSACVVKLRFYDLDSATFTLELHNAQSQRDKEAMKNKLADLMKKISQGNYSKPAALRRRMPCLAPVRGELLRCLIIDGQSREALTVQCVDTGETFTKPLNKLHAIPEYLLSQGR